MSNPAPYLVTILFVVLSALTRIISSESILVAASVAMIAIVCFSFAHFMMDLAQGRADRPLFDVTAFVSGHVICLLWLFAVLYERIGLTDNLNRDPHNLWSAVYLSVITWTTVGYGDVSPALAARPVAAAEAIIGYVVMGLLIAIFVTALQD